MSDDARQLLQDALRLPLEERATLIAALLASLDGDADDDADAAWAQEIAARATRALRGETEGKDWATVRAEIEARRQRGG